MKRLSKHILICHTHATLNRKEKLKYLLHQKNIKKCTKVVYILACSMLK